MRTTVSSFARFKRETQTPMIQLLWAFNLWSEQS